jgi:hypothetical protein
MSRYKNGGAVLVTPAAVSHRKAVPMSVLNDTPSPFASTGLPDESQLLPGYDDWCDEHETDFPNAQDIAWADEQDRGTGQTIARGNIAAVDAVTALFKRTA